MLKLRACSLYSMPMLVTWPSAMPRRSTGAPTAAAQRLVEAHDDHQRRAVGVAHRVGFVGCEPERRVVGCLRRLRLAGRRLKCEAADDHRRQRLRIEFQSARIEPQIHAARVPPARVGTDVLVVGRLHERLHVDAGPVLVEREADDPADLQMPIEQRRADVDRAERVAMQQIAAALLVSGDGGGVSRPVKSVCFCGSGRDPRRCMHRRAVYRPGNPRGADARSNDPEARVAVREPRCIARQLNARDHALEVGVSVMVRTEPISTSL